MLNGEKPVWHADKNTPGNAAKLVHKKGLIFQAAYMFKNCIRCRNIKCIIVKRQSDVWLNLDIPDERKCLPELNTSAQSARSDIFLMWVASLQNICAVIYDVRYSNIQNMVRVRRLYLNPKILENAVASRNKKALCHAAG